MQENNANKPDCFKCIYFTLTWEKKTPRSCKLYGFKTASMPSVVFRDTTGHECVGFKRKPDAKSK